MAEIVIENADGTRQRYRVTKDRVTIGRARESANTVKCMANLRQIGQAMTIYVGQSKGVLPIGLIFDDSDIHRRPGPKYKGESLDWTTLLMNIMNRKLGIDYADQPAVGQTDAGTRAVFLCPTDCPYA